MSIQSLESPRSIEWPSSKFVAGTLLTVGYAVIVLSLLYPIYMHLFVFD
jgi:hypothetical protein